MERINAPISPPPARQSNLLVKRRSGSDGMKFSTLSRVSFGGVTLSMIQIFNVQLRHLSLRFYAQIVAVVAKSLMIALNLLSAICEIILALP
jgi:hypothetical protein